MNAVRSFRSPRILQNRTLGLPVLLVASILSSACDPADEEVASAESRVAAFDELARPASEPVGPTVFMPGAIAQMSDYDLAVAEGDPDAAAGLDFSVGGEPVASIPGSLPFHIQRYGHFSNGGILDTGFPTGNWAAAVVGIQTTDGDINENGTGNPLFAYPYQFNGTWHVTFDLRSHQNNESWSVWVMFVNRSMTTTSNF